MGKQRSIGIFLLLSMFLSVLATCAQAEEMMVDIEGFAFQPATLTVPPGTVVTWTNQDNAPHTVTSTDGKFDSGSLSEGQEFSFSFTEPGVYDYYCTIHPSMRGQIEVTSASAKAAESPAAAAPERETEANQTSAPSGAGQQQPGFGAALALVGILAVASLLQRKV